MSKITKVAGIDFDTVIFRTALRLQGDTFDIDPEYDIEITDEQLEEGFEQCESELKTIMFNAKCTEYIAFITGNSNFRYNILPSYKWRRRNAPRPIALQRLKDLCLERLNCIMMDNIEADDACTMWFSHQEEGVRKVLCHIDKDLNQVKGTHYNPDKDEVYEVTEKDADAFLWIQVLAGDTADCYKGCPNVGNSKPKDKPDELSKAEHIVYGTLCTKPKLHTYTKGKNAGISEIKWEDYHDKNLSIEQRVFTWYVKGYFTKGGQGHTQGFNTTSGFEDDVRIKQSDFMFDLEGNFIGLTKIARDFVLDELSRQYIIARMLRYGESVPFEVTQLNI